MDDFRASMKVALSLRVSSFCSVLSMIRIGVQMDVRSTIERLLEALSVLRL